MIHATECSLPRCSACGQPARVIWVHGHGQCSHCKQNVEPCCQPEPAQEKVARRVDA
ncbi:MAG: hypothetical protein AAF533_19035 [Acidobacteriota bacterium]